MPVRPFIALFRPMPGCPIRTHLRAIAAMLALFFKLRRGGGRLRPILRFLRTKDPGSGYVTPVPRTTPAPGGGAEGCVDPAL